MTNRKLDLADLRARLHAQRDALRVVRQTGDEAAATVELDQSRVGRLSRMDALQAQAMSKESSRRRQIKLREIDAALLRLDGDEFGDCLSCGEPIAIKRLTFDPAVALCIDCASAAET